MKAWHGKLLLISTACLFSTGLLTGCGKSSKQPSAGQPVIRTANFTSSWKLLTTMLASPATPRVRTEALTVNRTSTAKGLTTEIQNISPPSGPRSLPNPSMANLQARGFSNAEPQFTASKNSSMNPFGPTGLPASSLPLNSTANQDVAAVQGNVNLNAFGDNSAVRNLSPSSFSNNPTNLTANRSAGATNLNADSATSLTPAATASAPSSFTAARLNPGTVNPTLPNPSIQNPSVENPSLGNPLPARPQPLTIGGSSNAPQLLPPGTTPVLTTNPLGTANVNPIPAPSGGTKSSGGEGDALSGGGSTSGGASDSGEGGTKVAGLPTQDAGAPGPGPAEVNEPEIKVNIPPTPSQLQAAANQEGLLTTVNSGLYLVASTSTGTSNPGMGVGSGDGHVQVGAFARLNVITPDGKQASSRITPNGDYCVNGQAEVPALFSRDNLPLVKLETGLPPNEPWVEIPGDPSYPRRTDICGELLIPLKDMLNAETHCARSMRVTVTYAIGTERYRGQGTLSCTSIGATAGTPYAAQTPLPPLTVQLNSPNLEYFAKPAASILTSEPGFSAESTVLNSPTSPSTLLQSITGQTNNFKATFPVPPAE